MGAAAIPEVRTTITTQDAGCTDSTLSPYVAHHTFSILFCSVPSLNDIISHPTEEVTDLSCQRTDNTSDPDYFMHTFLKTTNNTPPLLFLPGLKAGTKEFTHHVPFKMIYSQI